MIDRRSRIRASMGAMAHPIVDRVGGQLWWRVQLQHADDRMERVAGSAALEGAATIPSLCDASRSQSRGKER
jgi:hypothetical protein